MVGALGVDIHLHDTYFVVAHFHYVMMGGTVMAFLGGIHYWWPKMTGRMYNETLGKRVGSLGVHRVQRDVLHPVHHGQPGHAAPVLRLPGHAVARAAAPDVDHRSLRAGCRAAPGPHQRPAVAQARQAGAGQPVGRRHAGVDALHHPAGPPQLPPHAARDPRPVRLRGPVPPATARATAKARTTVPRSRNVEIGAPQEMDNTIDDGTTGQPDSALHTGPPGSGRWVSPPTTAPRHGDRPTVTVDDPHAPTRTPASTTRRRSPRRRSW